jgi:hypothetical protein
MSRMLQRGIPGGEMPAGTITIYGWRTAWRRFRVTGRHATSLAGRHLRGFRYLGGPGGGVQLRPRAPDLGRHGGGRLRAGACRRAGAQALADRGHRARPVLSRRTRRAARVAGGAQQRRDGQGTPAARGLGRRPLWLLADSPGHPLRRRGRAGRHPKSQRLQPLPAGYGPVRAAAHVLQPWPAHRPQALVRSRVPRHLLARAPRGRCARPGALGHLGRREPGDRLRAGRWRDRCADGRPSWWPSRCSRSAKASGRSASSC